MYCLTFFCYSIFIRYQQDYQQEIPSEVPEKHGKSTQEDVLQQTAAAVDTELD